MDKTTSPRPFTGWIIKRLDADKLEVATSHLPLDEEYWLALRHPTEVQAVGFDLLRGTHPGFAALTTQEQESTWREFRAYARQAEGFYRAASALHWKSSPLNYYYSFMNLAKAMMVSRGSLPSKPSSQPRKLRHGLTATVVPGTSGTPDKWSLSSQSTNDVFPQLYRLMIGTSLPAGTMLDSLELLQYVSSVAWQLYKCNRGPCAWWAGRWGVLTAPGTMWDMIVLPKEADVTRLPAAFASEYQEVPSEAAKELAMRIFSINARTAMHARFLERKTPFPTPPSGPYDTAVIEHSLKTAAQHCVFPYIQDTHYELAFGLPYRTGTFTIPMNEAVAAYAITYFLSSLVRYHPDYMDSIAESSDAWLVESFAKTVPLVLLRYLVTGALGHPLILEAT